MSPGSAPNPFVGNGGIIVNVTNTNTGGNIVFSNISFLTPGGGYDPNGYPPIVVNTLPDNQQATIFTAMAYSVINESTGQQAANPITQGTAVFFLPTGDSLTIEWDLDVSQPAGTNLTPSISPSSDYYMITGLSTPEIDGNTYTFNLVVAPGS
jgi:hypothetical protein